MKTDDIKKLLDQAASLGQSAQGVGKLIEAGMAIADTVRANVEQAVATAAETDAKKLRDRATELELTNRALSEQVERLLS